MSEGLYQVRGERARDRAPLQSKRWVDIGANAGRIYRRWRLIGSDTGRTDWYRGRSDGLRSPAPRSAGDQTGKLSRVRSGPTV